MTNGAVGSILDTFLNILYVSMKNQGKSIGRLSLGSEQDILICRETVGCLLIKLLEIDHMSKKLSREQWEMLGWCFLDEDEKVRHSIISSFSMMIQTTGLHIRFLAYSSLTVFDQNGFQLIKRSLPFALKRIRCTHDDLIGRAMETDDLKLLALVEEVIPECIVPYVFYLLSCIPSKNIILKGKNWDSLEKMAAASLRFLYSALRLSLREGSDNLSYLIQQLNLLSKRGILDHDPEFDSFATITKVAHQILHESIKTVENVQPFKGTISIPGDLFSEH